MDFDADPELRKLRDDFVASLPERRATLMVGLALARAGGEHPDLRAVVHRVAGAAETFGLRSLGELSAALEDRLERGIAPSRLVDGIALLVDALEWVVKDRMAAEKRIPADPRWISTISCDE